ncbi:hypothetical protein OIU77_026721 [Salix suchowensis]|uniref:Uncharacterized protein n=1 Tax=Salix suchowensis TaxID=1278906 RepID=A0ABQ9BQB9_9ROSI|nr:hypothetical protein OIU77_026721 [Salix suchowensis]
MAAADAASEKWLWFDISGGLASVIRLKASAIVARTGHAAKVEFWVALTESLKGRRGWPAFGKVKVREPPWSHIGNSHQRLNFDVANIKCVPRKIAVSADLESSALLFMIGCQVRAGKLIVVKSLVLELLLDVFKFLYMANLSLLR